MTPPPRRSRGRRPVRPGAPPLVQPAPTAAGTTSPTLEAARPRLRDRSLTVDRFWTTTGRRSPLVEPDPHDLGRRLVTFLWRDGVSAHVHLEVNKVTQGLHTGAMQHIPGTDIWHHTVTLDARWRGSYTVTTCDPGQRAALDGIEPTEAIRWLRAHSRHDPRNLSVEFGHEGGVLSVVELDRSPPQPWIHTGGRRATPPPCHEGPGGRRLWVHTPPPGPAAPPLLLVLDGALWAERGHVVAAVASLGRMGRIRQPLVVFVDNGGPADRRVDLSVDSPLAAELAHRVIPWVRRRFRVSADPRDVVVAGQSLGGLTALKTAFDHPHVVGAALAQSSSLWQDDMLPRAARADPALTRVWLEVGLHEPVLLEPHRRLRAELVDRDVPVAGYVEFMGGHDPVCWRGGIGDGLRALLAPR